MPKLKLDWSKWKIIRAKILERDNYQCQYCKVTMEQLAKIKGRTDRLLLVHHIFNMGGDNEENLVTLCYKGHYSAGILGSKVSEAMLRRRGCR